MEYFFQVYGSFTAFPDRMRKVQLDKFSTFALHSWIKIIRNAWKLFCDTPEIEKCKFGPQNRHCLPVLRQLRGQNTRLLPVANALFLKQNFSENVAVLLLREMLTQVEKIVLCFGFQYLVLSNAFQSYQFSRRQLTTSSGSTKLYFNFKDLLDKAFENDENLSKENKLQGMLEGPGDEENRPARRTLTSTQEKWRAKMSSTVQTMENLQMEMDLYLSGVPDKDPSNDLYGGRVNISSRDRKTGLAIPNEPTISSVRVEFLEGNKCRCTADSVFVLNESEGDWKLSDDGKQVRFRIQVTGYRRTVETKGTIQKIYWSNEEERTTQTSTLYRIPEGWLYGEAELSLSTRGKLVWNNGLLKIEQSSGLFGATSKMVPCGKFTAVTVDR